MNAAGPQDQRDDGKQGREAAQVLSALEDTLRQALASVPRDQVVRCIATALPVEVLVDESAGLHQSKVRKVSVSMPEELTEAGQAPTSGGRLQRDIAEAIVTQVKRD